MHSVDVDLLSVEHNTPMPKSHRIFGKYDAMFAKLKYGSCVVCEPDEKENISNGLRKYLIRANRSGVVRAVKRCEDGKARVWLLEK
jgi:hypothetical protein